ncbi:MAG: ketoacyl-ACP synthase III [Flavobacteriales bacterium]|nr:ketoacyl-ACP synthase III [Flavobacteriales bacterium]
MAFLEIPNIKISGLSATVPSQVVRNDDLKDFESEEIDLLKQTTGIHTRRLATKSQSAADLCYEAADRLLHQQQWNRNEIEILIFVSQTPSQKVPGDATQLQTRLGLSNNCLVLDINQGCSGYVYGLSVISSMMSASSLTKGLLLVGDTITKTLDKEDKSTVPIFSDAGSATTLEYTINAAPLYFNLESDGSKYKAIFQAKNGTLSMKGHDVFYFGASEVPQNINSLLERFKTDINDIDYFVFHQANLLLNEAIRRKLKIAKEQVPYSLQEFGNTSCATTPITLVNNLSKQLKTKQHRYILSGFGVGLSCGSVIVNIADIVCLDIIEV